MINESLTYADVLLVPQFSTIRSRKDVDVSQEFCGQKLKLAVISSNMDTVTGVEMANAMTNYGAQSALHRFCSIEDNVKMFKDCTNKPMVSIGVGKNELDRAKALYDAGAECIIIDVAHGAAIHVVEQYDKLREIVGYNASVVVGNFDNAASIYAFNQHSKAKFEPDAFKVSIGPGSMCTTRIVTGCGGGSITALQSCATTGFPIIADGGITSSGDFAKALAAGATVVMIGKMFAGTKESLSVSNHIKELQIQYPDKNFNNVDFWGSKFKYRGSASMDSYVVQDKVAEHRAPEGEATLVPYVGPVKNVLQKLEGGLRSSLSYVGARNLDEFRSKAMFVRVTNNTAKESTAHGVKE